MIGAIQKWSGHSCKEVDFPTGGIQVIPNAHSVVRTIEEYICAFSWGWGSQLGVRITSEVSSRPGDVCFGTKYHLKVL